MTTQKEQQPAKKKRKNQHERNKSTKNQITECEHANTLIYNYIFIHPCRKYVHKASSIYCFTYPVNYLIT